MSAELRQYTISAERERKDEQAVQAHILQLRIATEEEVRAVLVARTAKNVVMVNDKAGIKAMHTKFQSKTAGLKDVKKHAVAQTLAHQYLGLKTAMLATGFELSEEEILEIIDNLNGEDLQSEGLSIAVRNGIAILTTLRNDGKIFVLDTPETRKHFLAKPALSPIAKHKNDTTSRGKGKRRSKTLALKRLTRSEIAAGKELIGIDTKNGRPKNRGDCIDEAGPCPYVGCQYNLYLEVNPDTGSIKLNFPDIPVWEMLETCALNIADRGGVSLEEVGDLLNLTRERIRQIEVVGLEKLRETPQGRDILADGFFEESTEGLDLLGLGERRHKKKKKNL